MHSSYGSSELHSLNTVIYLADWLRCSFSSSFCWVALITGFYLESDWLVR